MILEVEKRYKVVYEVDDISIDGYHRLSYKERRRIMETLDDCAYSRNISDTETVKYRVYRDARDYRDRTQYDEVNASRVSGRKDNGQDRDKSDNRRQWRH